MKTNHTPGPWELHADNGTPFVFGPGSKMEPFTGEDGEPSEIRTRLIALVYGDGPEYNQVENARLVASSPDMLAALNKAREALDMCRASYENRGDYYDGWATQALVSVNSAIAKATQS